MQRNTEREINYLIICEETVGSGKAAVSFSVGNVINTKHLPQVLPDL